MDYITQKQLLLNQVLENTKSQTHAIEEEDLEKLDTLIIQRETIMKQVDQLDKESSTVIPTIPKEQLEPLKELLKHVIQIDNTNQSLMQKEFEHVKVELRKIRLARQRQQSYGNEYGLHVEEGLMFDTKGYN